MWMTMLDTCKGWWQVLTLPATATKVFLKVVDIHICYLVEAFNPFCMVVVVDYDISCSWGQLLIHPAKDNRGSLPNVLKLWKCWNCDILEIYMHWKIVCIWHTLVSLVMVFTTLLQTTMYFVNDYSTD